MVENSTHQRGTTRLLRQHVRGCAQGAVQPAPQDETRDGGVD